MSERQHANTGVTPRVDPRAHTTMPGSQTRSPASSPLRTVHGSFDPHGSSLCKGIFRHPVSQLYFRQTNDFYGN